MSEEEKLNRDIMDCWTTARNWDGSIIHLQLKSAHAWTMWDSYNKKHQIHSARYAFFEDDCFYMMENQAGHCSTLKKEDPASEWRCKLLDVCSMLNLSIEFLLEITKPMGGLTDPEKEEMAKKLFDIVLEGQTQENIEKSLSKLKNGQN